MSKELLHYIDQIGIEKGLDREIVIVAIEEALSSAFKKRLGTENELATTIDRLSGDFIVRLSKRVVTKVENRVEELDVAEALKFDPQAVVGGTVLIPMDLTYLGRIAAQVAKQVIIQKVREAERDMIHSGFKNREGELITGRVELRDRGDVIIELPKTEAILPKSQQIPHESFRVGELVKAYILEVRKVSRGPQIVLSRVHENFLAKLFELEVPEVQDGTVELKGIVREPGERAKVAVNSTQKDIDPVGACVGVKGSRVQAIVRELRGEKIDVIQWSDDIGTYVRNALSPAVMEEIRINNARKHILVVVPDEELSQAIGKKGQNVRLASRLVGWEIDIKSRSRMAEEVHAKEVEDLRQVLADRLDVTLGVAQGLLEAGYTDLKELRDVEPKELEKIKGIGKIIALRIVALARKG